MIFIRTDANEEIATGHIMRCMSIAEELSVRGIKVKFLISDTASSILLEKKNFEYIVLQTKWNDLNNQEEIEKTKVLLQKSCGAECETPLLFVDSYYVSDFYFKQLKPYAKLGMFDDLCKEACYVDFLINYNISYGMLDYKHAYENKATQLLLGSQYVPLRKQFLKYTDKSAMFPVLPDDYTYVLLICGGGDPFNILNDILERACKESSFNRYYFHVVAGAYHPQMEDLILLEKKFHNIELHCNVDNMAELMSTCDVAVTAASTVLYECCAMGLPAIFFVMADNQENDIPAFTKDNVMLYAGDIRKRREETVENIIESLHKLSAAPDLRKQMSDSLRKIVDGKGVGRIANLFERIFEIGSFYEECEFDCKEAKENVLRWLDGISAGRHISLWVDGRAAIEAALFDIENRGNVGKKVCVLPQYTCDTVILPFQKHGWTIYYYSIQSDLTVNTDEFEKLIKTVKPDVLLTHTYYGVDTIENIRHFIQRYREKNKLIYIEDMTQSLFLTEKAVSMTDYAVGSLRKWFAIPDGGFCISAGEIDVLEYGSYKEYIQIKQDAQKKKRMYLDGCLISKENYLHLNRKAEDMLYEAPEIYRMSEASVDMLKSIKKESVYQSRNENMLALDKEIQKMEGIRPLVCFLQNSAPLYYPVLVNNQKKIQKILRRHDVYAPVLWEIPEMIKNVDIAVKNIYDGMLALPCDQRYDVREMRRIISILKCAERLDAEIS